MIPHMQRNSVVPIHADVGRRWTVDAVRATREPGSARPGRVAARAVKGDDPGDGGDGPVTIFFWLIADFGG